MRLLSQQCSDGSKAIHQRSGDNLKKKISCINIYNLSFILNKNKNCKSIWITTIWVRIIGWFLIYFYVSVHVGTN